MELDPNRGPFATFDAWFSEALAADPAGADAAALATAGGDGALSVRMVLVKQTGPEGFVFYTNGLSRKGSQIRENDRAALCYYWKELGRQLRVEGRLEEVSAQRADAYFATRPRESQIGAWTSLQSQPLDSRATLDARFASFESKFKGQDVPRPPHWTGFCLVPDRIEFWQQGDHRLHDRFVFASGKGGGWAMTRLYP